MKTEIEKKEKIEIAKGDSPADMIRMAVNGGADLEKLSKLLDIQERWEANEARKAYHVAMSEFKNNPPKIDKDKSVSYGNTKYNHASLANVVEKITKELSKYGLSASWRTHQNGQIQVTCKITHILGHSEETTLSAAADKSGSKNDIQAIGSTVTYLQRYTLLSALGLATYDQDDDAQVMNIEPIDESQVVTLSEYISALKIDVNKFLKFFKIESIENLPKIRYQEAIVMLKEKEGKKK